MSDMKLMGAGKAGSLVIDTPDDISGLLLWLKADALSLNDGDPIASWTDSSGNDNHAAQATSNKRPTYQTNEQNGKPVARFDGELASPDYLTLTTPLDLASMTAFAVVKMDAMAAAAGNVIASSSGGEWAMRIHTTTNHVLNFNNGLDASSTGASGIDAGTCFLACVRKSGATINFYVNGTDETDDGTATASGVTIDELGAQSGGTVNPLKGDIAEIIIYDSALSAANRQAIEEYLNDKYAIY